MSNIRDLDKYRENWWDWTPLNGCFSGKIRVTDVDGLVERHGRFLMLEGKRLDDGSLPTAIPRGQQFTHDALCATGLFTVVILWGTPPLGPVRFVRVQTKQETGKPIASSIMSLQRLVKRWFAWADATSFLAHGPSRSM